MNILRNNSGLTLFGTMASVALTGLILMLMGQGMTKMFGVQKSLNGDKETQMELSRATQEILKIGRMAQRCSRIAPEYLECRIDMNHPPTQEVLDDAIFRFGIWDKKFHLKKLIGSQFEDYMIFDHIKDFQICDDQKMLSETEPCTIKIDEGNHPLYPPAGRFFRFQLIGTATGNNRTAELYSRKVQSAFFVRHPTAAGIMYEWGQWHQNE